MIMKARDAYDLQIEEMVEQGIEKAIMTHWGSPRDRGLPLFQYVGTGCLTMVKRAGRETGIPYEGYAKQLTDEIKNDPLIPTTPFAMRTREQLERCAYYQRRCDREFPNENRVTETAYDRLLEPIKIEK